ncbi:hypothetical protein B0H16DRAFT_265210 [Mycena metata]|uniref:Uncharacterized protein n=1 Tax=Mycena metata TaxID=1033252 RepID=A0AAD7HSN9_9AGAR|nr:hypothetical protein B0H16DRAFT_265210 [Mycena metata]
MATELKERDDDGRSHRSHRSHRHQDQDDDTRSHRSRRDSHRSREDADRDRDRRRHHSHSPERRHSTASRHDKDRPHSRSSHHEHREHDHDKDTVKAPAYPPDFLRLYSPAGSIGGNDKFDVITGAEAVEFTRQEQAADGTTLPGALADALPASSTTPPSGAPLPLMAMAKSPSATSHKSLTNHNALDLHRGGGGSKRLHPVVFALPRSATNTGKKVVDFYMTWRGKTKTHPLKGPSRRANFLDNEFRRVRETLDGEWRRAGRAIKGGFGAGSTTSDAPLPVLSKYLSFLSFFAGGSGQRAGTRACAFGRLAYTLRSAQSGFTVMVWVARARRVSFLSFRGGVSRECSGLEMAMGSVCVRLAAGRIRCERLGADWQWWSSSCNDGLRGRGQDWFAD